MADNEINVRHKLAYKTFADWYEANPVLLMGELSFVSDLNNIYKIGDGETSWRELPFDNAGGVGTNHFYWNFNEDTESVSLMFRDIFITVGGDSSSIAISDALAEPAKSLKVTFTPKQDLHGYDNPWPAGGGVNLFNKDEDFSSNNYYYNNNGEQITSLNYRTTDPIKIKPNTYYYWAINGVPPATSATHIAPRVVFLNENKEWIASGSALGAMGSSDISPQTAAYARLPVYIASMPTVDVAMFVEGDSIPTSYSPYSNICPITGYDSVSVDIAEDTQATPTTYTVSFTQQGTVYGGTVDIVSGELSVNYGYADMGALSWTYNSNEARFICDNGIIVPTTASATVAYKAMCERYPIVPRNELANHTLSIHYSGHSYINVKDSFYTGATAFKSAMSEVQLVYELAEPQTYNLTPQQVQMLLNDNVLQTNDGTITLTYKTS